MLDLQAPFARQLIKTSTVKNTAWVNARGKYRKWEITFRFKYCLYTGTYDSCHVSSVCVSREREHAIDGRNIRVMYIHNIVSFFSLYFLFLRRSRIVSKHIKQFHTL